MRMYFLNIWEKKSLLNTQLKHKCLDLNAYDCICTVWTYFNNMSLLYEHVIYI